MNPAPLHTLRVDLPPQPPRSYPIAIGPGILESQLAAALERAAYPGRCALVIADSGPPRHFADAASRALAASGRQPHRLLIEPAEDLKTLDTLRLILLRMEDWRLERSDPIIAIGGGITGDIAGLVAATYRRGSPIIQCPTTLLAMVDASVGGKTAVNLDPPAANLLKNAAGAFHQPDLVIIDTTALDSLPPRHFRAGLAECLKHAMIAADWGDPGLTAWTPANLPALLARDPAALAELIRRNVALKARVVADDERETSPSAGRATLNLGHTFAHAIEPIHTLSPSPDPADAPLLHGEAVALGLVAAAAAAHHAGLCHPSILHDTRVALRAAGLPTSVHGLPHDDALLEAMSHDKKARSGRLRLILPVAPGRVRVVPDPPPDAVRAGWAAIRAELALS